VLLSLTSPHLSPPPSLSLTFFSSFMLCLHFLVYLSLYLHFLVIYRFIYIFLSFIALFTFSSHLSLYLHFLVIYRFIYIYYVLVNIYIVVVTSPPPPVCFSTAILSGFGGSRKTSNEAVTTMLAHEVLTRKIHRFLVF
jgi:hypothetical protein